MNADTNAEKKTDGGAATRIAEAIERETSARAIWLDETDSTNDRGRDWLRAEAGFPDAPPKSFAPFAPFSASRPPFVVGAERQTRGRGRGDHRWDSWRGAATFSLVARWADLRSERRESAELSRRVAKAVAETARELVPGANVVVKEPNDVYCGGRKLAGILIESPDPRSVVVGIGANVGNRSDAAPPELRTKVVSLVELLEETGKTGPFDVDALRTAFVVGVVRRILDAK